MGVSDPTKIYCDNLSSINLRRTPSSTPGLSTLRCTTIFSASVSSLVKSNLRMFRRIGKTDIFTKSLGLDKLRQFSGALGLRHLDVPNLRGRTERKDREREQETSGSARESDEESDFGSDEEAEGSY